MNAQSSAPQPLGSQKAPSQRQITPNYNGIPSNLGDSFDFDVWATAVRQQMLEALNKRECRRS